MSKLKVARIVAMTIGIKLLVWDLPEITGVSISSPRYSGGAESLVDAYLPITLIILELILFILLCIYIVRVPTSKKKS